MIRSTRAVSRRTTIDYCEMSEAESSMMAEGKMTKKKKKELFLKNLDNQVVVTKKKIKMEQAAYIKSINDIYNTLIGKIPKAIQNELLDQFIANDGNVVERTEAESAKLISRPSEIADLQALPKKRLATGKTPAKPTVPPKDDLAVPEDGVQELTKRPATELKNKKKGTSTASSTSSKANSRAQQENSVLATPMENTRSRRVLRSATKTSTVCAGPSTVTKTTASKSRQQSGLKSAATPFLSGTAKKGGKSAASKQQSTVSRKRSSSRRAETVKAWKAAVMPLGQRNQQSSDDSVADASQFAFGIKQEEADVDVARHFKSVTMQSSAHSSRGCRPDEKANDAIPLAESQPTFVCPLDDGNSLTISCDADFRNLTLPESVMDNLRSFQKKLQDFLKISS